MSEPRPIAPSDQTTAAFWEATSKQELTLQKCSACGHVQHYPRGFCISCGQTHLETLQASGFGRIVSFTIVHRAPHPAFQPPYAVALVELREGPVVLTNIVGCDPDEIACDQSVQVTWEDLPDGRKLPLFTLERN
jgi:uncharacterized protein